MNRNALALAVVLALSLPCAAMAQEAGTDAGQSRRLDAVPLVFTGGNGQVGLAVDQDGRIQGEALGVFGFNGRRAFLAEGWLGAGGAGGVKFGYHWLRGGADGHVLKLQFAADASQGGHRKATIGFGSESEAGEFGVTWSHGITGNRLVDSELERTTSTVTGTQGGRPYRQQVVVDHLAEWFERPYEQGFGLRFGRFNDRNLLRLRGGFDLERGHAHFDGSDRPEQHTASFGMDKYFAGTPYSISIDLSHSHHKGALVEDRTDARATVRWRYWLGAAFESVAVPAPVATPAPAAPATERRLVRNEVEISGNARFGLDNALLDAAALRELAPLVDRLRTALSGKVEIVGHACDLGADDYNQALSEARAMAVRDWLVAQGVPADALSARGEGERSPVVANDSEQGRSRNRRVELHFTTIEETRVQYLPQPATKPATPSYAPVADAWVARALRNLPAHKRDVDSYRIERTTTTTTLGPIEYLNRAPIAVDDAATAAGGTSVAVAVLANDSDPDGDAISIASHAQPAHGSTTLQGSSIVYTADPGYVGADSFTYTIADGHGGTATATVAITIQAPAPPPAPSNNAPVAIDDVVTVNAGASVDIDVLGNDTDADNDLLSVPSWTAPVHGTVARVGSRLRYTASPGYEGADTFTYAIDDGHGGTDTATVTVHATIPNTAPLAVDDLATVHTSQTVDIAVLGNDVDADNDPLSLVSWTAPAHGTVTLIGSLLRYTPDQDYEGTDGFTYVITDGQAVDDAVVTVEVTPLP